MSSGGSLSSDISLAHDPYERMLNSQKYSKNLVSFDSSSKFAKKWNKFKAKMDGAKDNMIQGAIMGFMVGGLFGFAIGCYTALQTRRFMAIPISTLVSGGSFSFILGCGSMIRTMEVPEVVEGGIPLQEEDWVWAHNFNSRLLSKEQK